MYEYTFMDEDPFGTCGTADDEDPMARCPDQYLLCSAWIENWMEYLVCTLLIIK